MVRSWAETAEAELTDEGPGAGKQVSQIGVADGPPDGSSLLVV